MAPPLAAEAGRDGGRDDSRKESPPPPPPPPALLPSSLLREVIARVRTSTNPPGVYCTEKTAKACTLVSRDWCESVLGEARTLRCGPAAVNAASSPSPSSLLAVRSMDRLTGLRLVDVRGDDDGEAGDTGLSPEYVRNGRAWRQVVVLNMRGAPRRLARLLAALAPAPPAPAPAPSLLPSLAELTVTGLPAPLVAELARCLTRDHLPALHRLTLTLEDGCLSPLDYWPFGEEEEEQEGVGGGDEPAKKREARLTLPPPIVELSVLGPPVPLGPPAPMASRPEEDASLNLEACATVTPRLLRALAPTLRSLAVAISPSPRAAVLVPDPRDEPEGEDGLFARGQPPRAQRRRQLVPLEALAPLFVAAAGGGGGGGGREGGAAAPAANAPGLSRLVLCGDLDLSPPDHDAPVPSPAPLPGAAAAAYAQALAQLEAMAQQQPPPPFLPVVPPQHEFLRRFEASARRHYSSGRYEYARRGRSGDFAAVFDALAPGLESLTLLPSRGKGAGNGGEGGGADADAKEREEGRGGRLWRLPPPLPELLLGPDPGLVPRGRLRAWLPECLAGLTRLTELALADGSVDALRPPPRGGGGLPVSRATTGRAPPALRRLSLGGAGGEGEGEGEGEGGEGGGLAPPALLRGPAPVPITLEGDAFAALPPALAELQLLLRLRRPSLPRCLLDGRMPGLRHLDVSAEAARGDAPLLATLALRPQVRVTVEGEAWEDWYAHQRYEEGGGGGADDDAGSGWSGDGDHWAADYAAGSD